MNIGLVTDTYLPDINGVVSSTVTLKNALEKAGHTVYVITNHAGTGIQFEDGILRLPGIKLKSFYGYKVSSPINVGAGSYIEEMDLDVIHLQTNFGVGLYGQYLANTMNIPLVDTYHTMYTDYTHYINPKGFAGFDRVSKDAIKAASRAVCNNAQAVVAPSQKTREALIEYGVLAPIYVVPTGLDLDKFMNIDPDSERVKEIRAQVSTDPEDLILVFVGRLAKEKSLEIPIEAIVQNPNPHIHLAIVGTGPDEDFYRNLTDSLHGNERIHFLGAAAPEEIGQYYQAFDAFVSASLSETQGMTYLEAMAAGKMVFGRRDDVLSELLDEDVTGFYFDTPAELNEKIDLFLQLSRQQKEEARKACQQKIMPYTAETFAYAMERVYSQAIDDYSLTYEVEKIQFSGNYVFLQMTVDSEKEPVKMIIPIDDFFELKISLHTKLDDYMVRSYLDIQNFYWAMYKVEQRLASREMTYRQVVDYCVRKLDSPLSVANQVADELELIGKINDRSYAMEKAEYYQSIGSSKRQIEQRLYKAGIDPELIREACNSLSSKQEKSNAKKLAKRLAKGLKAQSVRRKRQEITHKLILHGYLPDAAKEAAEELDFNEDHDTEALQDAFEKALRLYASKTPDAQRAKIRTYCLRQGFNREDIDALMESEDL
ncbi:RecX family transcriptional regulator [Erysipelotrichaceae bacterium RD49]|nr:RecX family transcriptional regulator [Erysipelotrichaceae bacterium RD49]